MQWFRSYRRVAICVALASDLMLWSFGGTAHVTQVQRDSAQKTSIAAFVHAATPVDITEEDGCGLMESAWGENYFYLAHRTKSNGFETAADLQPEGILELPFKPLFCALVAPEAATLTL